MTFPNALRSRRPSVRKHPYDRREPAQEEYETARLSRGPLIFPGRPGIVIAVLVSSLVLASCIPDLGWRGFKISNQTGVPITVTSTVNGHEQVLVTDLQPGLYQPITGYPGTQCVRMLLVARDAGGNEVDRSDGDVCLDQTWVVRGAKSS